MGVEENKSDTAITAKVKFIYSLLACLKVDCGDGIGKVDSCAPFESVSFSGKGNGFIQ